MAWAERESTLAQLEAVRAQLHLAEQRAQSAEARALGWAQVVDLYDQVMATTGASDDELEAALNNLQAARRHAEALP